MRYIYRYIHLKQPSDPSFETYDDGVFLVDDPCRVAPSCLGLSVLDGQLHSHTNALPLGGAFDNILGTKKNVWKKLPRRWKVMSCFFFFGMWEVIREEQVEQPNKDICMYIYIYINHE